MTCLSDRVAVITAGNRGIGRAIATGLAAAGATVVVTTRDPESIDPIRHEFARNGHNVTVVPCDITDDRSMESIATSIAAQYGRIDIVVANAGVAGPTAAMHEIEPDAWRECIEVDLTGVYSTFRPFIPGMITRRSGSLIAISSVTGKRPLPGRSPYAAAKLGVIGLVRTLAVELGPSGIRVNAVCPGSVDGPRIQSVFAAAAAARGIPVDDVRREHADAAALQRLTTADEVADLCTYLASDAATAITGQDINVSAGSVMS